jgi:DNA-binding beta-propeller fold protein YncE
MSIRIRRPWSPAALPAVAAVLTLLAALPFLAGCARGPAAPLAWVAVAGNNHVQVIDLATGETLRKVYSGSAPWRLILSPGGGRLFVQHWGAGTTAAVDLADGEVVRLLPGRGPGVFTADGARFVTFDWPSSALDAYDAKTLERLSERVTEIPEVYDLAADPEGRLLYGVQFDPMAKGPRSRYGYALALPLDLEATADDPAGVVPASLRTGQSPAAVRAVRSHPFLLTADRETNGLTLLNKLGDGRAVPTCPAPQAVLLSPDETRMVVPCWLGDGARQSRVVTYRTDFSTRPWPTIVQEGEAVVEGAVVGGAFTPSGDRVLLVDRRGNRLLVADPGTLELEKEIPTGDVPLDVVVVPADARSRERLARGESRARRRLKEALAGLRTHARPFGDLSWTETVSWAGAEPAADPEAEPVAPESRSYRTSFRLPDAFRAESEDGSVRLAEGGFTASIDPSGRFWTGPRQELISAVYALPNLPEEEAVRRLAGDVPGSPFLRGGIAVDVAAEVEEAGSRSLLVGALAPGASVAQLWIDLDSGRPTHLVEHFPVFRGRGHGDAGFGGLVETKLYDFGKAGGIPFLPGRMERVVDGRLTQEIQVSQVVADAGLPAERFSLARLGGVARRPAPSLVAPASGVVPASGGDLPGRPVPVQRVPAYLAGPGEPHGPYNSSPPTSGPRLDHIADWGVHPVPVPLELQAHNLEHGGVLLQYNCPEGCADLELALADLVRDRDHVLIAPYPLTDAKIVLTAWGRILELESYDPARILAFVDAWAGTDHHQESGGPVSVGAH